MHPIEVVKKDIVKKDRGCEEVPDTYYVNNDFANVIKFMKITSHSTRTSIKQKKRTKIVFQKNR